MLERVARCLETRGRASVRGKTKQVRSQRHLHSAFWSHGAGDINLPAWWTLLLQTTAATDTESKTRARTSSRKVIPASLEDIFLDFLYPAQTLALIKRLQRSTSAHHHAAQNVQKYTRSFTSIAQEVVTGVKASDIEDELDETTTVPAADGANERKTICEIINLEHPGLRYDELWQKYQDLVEKSQSLLPQDLIKMLRCLVNSSRSVDLERALALFEGTPAEMRRAIHYSYAITAALGLSDLDTAVSVHRDALSRTNRPVGVTAILGFAVNHEVWALAIETWVRLWHNRLSYYTLPDLWAAVDALPLDDLIQKASAAIDFANATTKNAESTGAEAARDFASELTRHAFTPRGVDFDIHKHAELVNKAKTLDTADYSLGSLAFEQLLSVDKQEFGHRALHLYRSLRLNSGWSPAKQNLETITQRLIKARSPSGLMMLYDDWKMYFANMPTRYAISAAKIFSYNGHVEATENVLTDFISQHGKPKRIDLYHCMLRVHSRRVDTAEVVRCFDTLQERFGFEPDVKAWNSLISAFVRADNIAEALNYVDKMRNAGLQADSTTYYMLMSYYARRGDRDAVDGLYQQSKAESVPLTTRMVNVIVLVNVNDDKLEDAEQLVQEATEMDLDEPRTFMWNLLLNAHALRKNLNQVSSLYKRMRELGVPFDNMTYAALMTSMTMTKNPDSARKIMDTVMPRMKLKRTALHYAIVMRGYLGKRQPSKVFRTYRNMLRSGIRPNMSTQNVVLRAAGSVDKLKSSSEERPEKPEEYRRAQQTFEQTLANLDPSELAASEPRMFAGPNPLPEAFYSSYFEYLIFLYGSNGAIDKAAELYDRLITSPLPLRGDSKRIEESPPIRLLSALMATHRRTNDDSEMQRCWNLALEKSEQLACKSKADTFRQGWVLHARRFVINAPLREYITYLTDHDRIDDLMNTIRNLLHAGYALNSVNWNKYIQALAGSRDPTHRNLAFRMCERELIPGWPGWQSFGNVAFGMKAKWQKNEKTWVGILKLKGPSYVTLVVLTRTYMEAKVREGGGAAKILEGVAPKTVDTIVNMPRLEDQEQSEILRQDV